VLRLSWHASATTLPRSNRVDTLPCCRAGIGEVPVYGIRSEHASLLRQRVTGSRPPPQWSSCCRCLASFLVGGVEFPLGSPKRGLRPVPSCFGWSHPCRLGSSNPRPSNRASLCLHSVPSGEGSKGWGRAARSATRHLGAPYLKSVTCVPTRCDTYALRYAPTSARSRFSWGRAGWRNGDSACSDSSARCSRLSGPAEQHDAVGLQGPAGKAGCACTVSGPRSGKALNMRRSDCLPRPRHRRDGTATQSSPQLPPERVAVMSVMTEGRSELLEDGVGAEGKS
jgi:hypothetical protein